jgi:hypothetical protein
VCVCIYLYIERERQRERETEGERELERFFTRNCPPQLKDLYMQDQVHRIVSQERRIITTKTGLQRYRSGHRCRLVTKFPLSMGRHSLDCKSSQFVDSGPQITQENFFFIKLTNEGL